MLKKKLTLARKYDRMEFTNKCFVNFIKTLHHNNEKKGLAITSFSGGKLKAECENGIREAEQLFFSQKAKHEKMKSVNKRLDTIHKYCVYTEMQASQGFLKEHDCDPKPTPVYYPDLDFAGMCPSYHDMLNPSIESPFKGKVDENGAPLDTKQPLLTCTLMTPYSMPQDLKDKSRIKKAKIRKEMAEEKAAKDLARKTAKI